MAGVNRRYAIFNTADIGAGLEVAQGGLVLTTSGNALSTARLCRGSVYQSGYQSDAHFLAWGEDGAIANVVLGICSADAGLSTEIGGDAYGVGYRPATGEVLSNGVVLTTLATAALRDVVTLVLDYTDVAAPVIEIRKNGSALGTVAVPAGLIGEPLTWGVSLGSTVAGDLQVQAICGSSTGQREPEFPVPGSTGWWEPGDAVPTARLCTRDYISAPTDSPANTRYEGVLAVESIRRTFGVQFWVDGVESSVVQSTAEVIVHDALGRLDAWVENDVHGVPATLMEIDRNGALADGDLIGQFVVEEVQALDDGRKRIKLRSGIPELEEPLQRRLIRPDAAEEAANTPEPVLLGACLSIKPPLVDGLDYLYLVADRALGKLGKIRDDGDPFNPATDYTIQPGGRSFVLTSPPDGVVTLDASSMGEGISGSSELLTGSGLGRWDSTTNATVVGTALRLNDDGASPSTSGTIEATAVKSGVILAGKSYRLMLNFEDRRGFFNGAIEKVEVAWSTGGKYDRWHVVSDLGVHTLEIANTTAGPLDLVLRLIGTQRSTATGAGDFADIEDATISLVEIVQDEQDEANLDPMPFADLATAVLSTRKGLPTSRWSVADAQAIDTDSGSEGIGYYATTPVPARDPLELALIGYTGCMWEDRDGVLRFSRLVAPEDVPEGEWGEEIDWDVLGQSDLQFVADRAPGLSLSMACTRNWHTMQDSELSTDDVDVTFAYRRSVNKKHRHTVSTEASQLARKYRDADLRDPVETILHRKADAQAEINRIGAIYRPLRRWYWGKVPLQSWTPMVVHRLKCSRYSWLQAGAPVLMRKVDEDRSDRTAIIRVWG